jgi:hypothetical protein
MKRVRRELTMSTDLITYFVLLALHFTRIALPYAPSPIVFSLVYLSITTSNPPNPPDQEQENNANFAPTKCRLAIVRLLSTHRHTDIPCCSARLRPLFNLGC